MPRLTVEALTDQVRSIKRSQANLAQMFHHAKFAGESEDVQLLGNEAQMGSMFVHGLCHALETRVAKRRLEHKTVVYPGQRSSPKALRLALEYAIDGLSEEVNDPSQLNPVVVGEAFKRVVPFAIKDHSQHLKNYPSSGQVELTELKKAFKAVRGFLRLVA